METVFIATPAIILIINQIVLAYLPTVYKPTQMETVQIVVLDINWLKMDLVHNYRWVVYKQMVIIHVQHVHWDGY